MNYYTLAIWWAFFAPTMYRCCAPGCPHAGETSADRNYFCMPVEVEP